MEPTLTFLAEYIWIDGTSPTPALRSKTKVIIHHQYGERSDDLLDLFPEWVFDGSSTCQADGGDSDRLLKPVCAIPDPVRLGAEFTIEDGGVSVTGRVTNYLVLCEVLMPDGSPHPSNYRAKLREVLDAGADKANAWFGYEQEYTFFKGSSPLGFPGDRRHPAAQGPYYCGVGADEVYGRAVVEDHLRACLEAGIYITGVNAEVMPGQWEFQVGGPGGDALTASDHLWLARWLLYRVGEDHGITATLDPKPVPGDWNGAGMHTNFSTAAMRTNTPPSEPGVAFPYGIDAITAACEALGQKVPEHLTEYGDGIEMRLTGKHETCRFDQFKYGVSDRTASIRIPTNVAKAGCGYLEDRRPNGNADPYRVAARMLRTVCGL